MRTETLRCAHCGQMFEKATAQANRQRRALGVRVRFFCTMRCFGASRRTDKPKALRVAEKAAYDRQYRFKNRAALKAKKAEYFQRTYDPEQARIDRARMRDRHRRYLAKYNARPEWKSHKREYDIDRRASEYGAFAEAQKILVLLEREIRSQPWYERAKERGYFDNNRSTNQRKRHEHISRW